LKYSIDTDNHTYTITGNNSYVANNLVMPEAVMIDDVSYVVTTIGGYAFNRCGGLTGNLVIPNSVTTIGDFTFNHCEGLTGNLVIHNSVTTINATAFQCCIGLHSIILPDTIVG
jgi:hypothetical protein